MSNADLAARLSAAGRARVLDRFTWQACATGTVEHYRWIIEEQHRRRAATP